jgi:hypothetical protein
VIIARSRQYVLLDVGADNLWIVDVSDPLRPQVVHQECHLGLFYGDQITDGLTDSHLASAYWTVTGIYWYDFTPGRKPCYTGINYPYGMRAQDGAAVYHDKLLLVNQGRYVFVTPDEKRPPSALPSYGIDGIRLGGKPCLHGDVLVISNRFDGQVFVLDVRDIEHPVLLKQYRLTGNPGRTRLVGNRLLIPAGYEGLLLTEELELSK